MGINIHTTIINYFVIDFNKLASCKFLCVIIIILSLIGLSIESSFFLFWKNMHANVDVLGPRIKKALQENPSV